MTGRLDKLYKVTIRSGGRQQISFFRKKKIVNKFISGTKKLAKKHKIKQFEILVRKPLKKKKKKR